MTLDIGRCWNEGHEGGRNRHKSKFLINITALEILKLFLLLGGSVTCASATSWWSVAVLLKQGHPREGLAAAGARVALDAGVRLCMRAQVGAVGERSMAGRTPERLFTRMRAQMSLKQPRS